MAEANKNPFLVPVDTGNKNPFLVDTNRFPNRLADNAASEAIQSSELSSALEAPVDISQDLDSFLDRRAIAGLEKIQDKANLLQERRPQDEVRVVQDGRGTERLMIRLEGEEAFRPVDISGGSFKGELGDLAGNLLNFETLLGTAASFLPGGPAIRAGRTALGTGGGDIIDTAIDKLQGQDTRDTGEVLTDAAVSAAIGAGGEVASSGLQGFFNFALNRGSVKPSIRTLQDSVREANKIIESDPHLREATVGQQGNRFVRTVEAQSERLADPIVAYKLGQSHGLEASVREFAGELDYSAIDDEALDRIVNNGRFQARQEIADDLRIGNTDRDAGGRALQSGLFDLEDPSSYIAASTVNINRKFQQASELASGQDIAFDLKPIRALISEIEQGKPVPGGGNASPEITGELRAVIDSIKGIEGDLIPNTFEIDGQAFSGLEALREYRTRLNSFFSDPTLRGTVEEANAKRLRAEITKMIENPVGGDDSFVKALQAANTAYKEQQETLELDFIRHIADSDEPGQLIDWLVSSERPQNTVQVLKSLVPEGRFRQIQDSVVSDLVNNPGRISSALDAVGRDPRTRTVLLSSTQQRQLSQYAQQVSRIDKSQLSQLVNNQTAMGDRALQLVTEGTPTDIKLLEEEGVDVASTFLNKMIQDATETVEGRTFVNPKSFSDNLETLFQSAQATENMSRLFDDETLKFIRDRQRVASLYAGLANGGGAGLQINELVANVASLNPAKTITAAAQIRFYGILGNILTSKPFLRYMRLAKDPFDSQAVRTGTVITSILAGQQASQEGGGRVVR